MSTMPKSETPETDRARFRLTWRDGAYYVSRAEIGSMDVVSYELASNIEEQRDKLEQRNARLAEALEAFVDGYADGYINGHRAVLKQAQAALKENKP